MRVLRNILLFLVFFVVVSVAAGFLIDAVTLLLFGSLSEKADQALVVVKTLIYLVGAVVIVVKFDAGYQRRAAARSAPAAPPAHKGESRAEEWTNEETAPRDAVSPMTAPPPDRGQSPETGSPNPECGPEPETQPAREVPRATERRRLSTPVIVLAALGLLALGTGLGAVLMSHGGSHNGGSASLVNVSPSPSNAAGLRASRAGLSVGPDKLRTMAEYVLGTTQRLAQDDRFYWDSPEGRAELEDMRETLDPVKTGLVLLDIAGNQTPREARLLRAIKNHAIALDGVLEGVLGDGVTQLQFRRLKTTYVNARAEYREF